MRLQYPYSYCLFVICLNLWLGVEAAGQSAVEDCATCHQSIVGEWLVSLHAAYYTSPVFLTDKESRSTAEESCGCQSASRLNFKDLANRDGSWEGRFNRTTILPFSRHLARKVLRY